jgi:hypothetical protein
MLKVKDGIATSDKIKIVQNLIPISHTASRPQYPMSAEYITIHNTADSGVDVYRMSEYVITQTGYKSWHFTVGSKEIHQHLPITESGWHSGDGQNGTGNRKSIGIEICEVDGAEELAIKFVAELLKALNMSIDKVVSHKHWSGKNCPRLILPHWNDFIEDIRKEMNEVMLTVEEAKKLLKENANIDDNSIQYLEYYKYSEDLIKKLAGAMVKEAIVEPPKPNNPKVETSKVEFTRYNNGMTELKGSPENLVNEIVDKRIYDITEFTNCTNGVFYMLQGNGKTHPTSILYEDGITYQAVANHYKDFGCPQSVFIIHKDNTVDMKRIKNLSELNLNNIRLVVGGLGLINTQDPKFYYSPVTEGFKRDYASNGVLKDFSDVLRKTNKTVLGYNKRLNKCYLLTAPNVSHGELIKIISDNSTGEAYDIAISVDGGGSSFMDADWKYVFKGQDSRQIYNILRFK